MSEKPRCKITIIQERCKGCGFCVEFCPKKALAISKVFSSKGYLCACPVDEADCANCRLCELICPDFAIKVDADDERSKTA
ncbi:MAG: ferredoxin family protein [Chloroflexota bacterium]